MSVALGRREQNRRSRRQALIASARTLCEQRGFEGVTVEEIAQAAGVSKRTFFRYFASKEDVVFPEHEQRLERFGDLVRMRMAGEPPVAAVQRAFVALGSQMMADRDEVVALQRIVDDSPALLAADRLRDRQWDAVVAVALAGQDPPTLDHRIAAGAVMGALRATLRVWFDGGGEDDLVAMGLRAFAALDAGFGG